MQMLVQQLAQCLANTQHPHLDIFYTTMCKLMGTYVNMVQRAGASDLQVPTPTLHMQPWILNKPLHRTSPLHTHMYRAAHHLLCCNAAWGVDASQAKSQRLAGQPVL